MIAVTAAGTGIATTAATGTRIATEALASARPLGPPGVAFSRLGASGARRAESARGTSAIREGGLREGASCA
jgi:hypothetical protein